MNIQPPKLPEGVDLKSYFEKAKTDLALQEEHLNNRFDGYLRYIENRNPDNLDDSHVQMVVEQLKSKYSDCSCLTTDQIQNCLFQNFEERKLVAFSSAPYIHSILSGTQPSSFDDATRDRITKIQRSFSRKFFEQRNEINNYPPDQYILTKISSQFAIDIDFLKLENENYGYTEAHQKRIEEIMESIFSNIKE